MYYNSKVEVRVEAVRLAAILKDVTSENIIKMSKEIEAFIITGIDLPDVYDPNSYMKDLAERIGNLTKEDKKTPGVDPNLLKTLAHA